MAAADGRWRAGAPGQRPGRADRGRAALRLARTDGRLRAPLPQRRRARADHRLDGAAQAQPAALAPHRRPGLAPGNQALSEADRSRRLAHAARRRRARRRGPAAPLRRLLHPGPGARDRRVRAGAAHHGDAGGRNARPRAGGDRGLSRARRDRLRAAGVQRLGRAPLPVQRRRQHLRLPGNRADRGDGCLPQPLRPYRRRRGGQAAVGGLAARAAAHARARRGQCARPAELVHHPHREVPVRARSPPGGLGRDPRGRPAAGGDGDVLARHRGRDRRRARRPRCDPDARRSGLSQQPPERGAGRTRRPRRADHPGQGAGVRAGARRARRRAGEARAGRAGEPVERVHAQLRRPAAHGVPAPRRAGRSGVVAEGRARPRRLPAPARPAARALPAPRDRVRRQRVRGAPHARGRRRRGARARRAVDADRFRPDPLHPRRQRADAALGALRGRADAAAAGHAEGGRLRTARLNPRRGGASRPDARARRNRGCTGNTAPSAPGTPTGSRSSASSRRTAAG